MTAREIAALFEDLELRLIASLKRNLARHKAEEKDEGFDWPAWQAEKLRSLQRFRRENKSIMAEYSDQIDAETRALMRRQFAEADGSAGAFFGVNARKLDALIEEMTHNEGQVEKAALRYMDDVYRKTILRAASSMAAGGMTLQQATDLAVKDFLAQGINCVRYRNGRQVNIATYAEMALRTNSTRAMLLGEAQLRERLGIDTVLVSQYGACSDTCLPWQGRVYIDDVWQPYHGPHTPGGTYGVSRNGRQYPLLSVAVRAGLLHPNCRHHLTTWIEGVSTRPEPMDKAECERVSKLEKKQRYLETQVRRWKRLAEGTQDPEKAAAYRRRVRGAQKAVREFVGEHSDVLRRDYWRERYDQTVYPKAAQSAIRNTGAKLTFNPTADFKVSLPFYDSEINESLSRASRRVAEQGGLDRREHLVMVDLETGEHLFVDDDSGETSSVGGSAFWHFIRQNMSRKLAFVHNHLTDGFFSETDMRTLLTTANIYDIIATRIDGVQYAAHKIKSVPGNLTFDELYKSEIADLTTLLRNGTITAGERTQRREILLVENLLRDYTEGLMEFE